MYAQTPHTIKSAFVAERTLCVHIAKTRTYLS